MFVDDNPEASLDDVLAHYGVLGMKWGVHRQRATTADIHRARRHLKREQDKYGAIEEKMHYGRNLSPGQKAANDRFMKQLAKLDDEYDKDPAKAIATRTTRGEKAALIILGGPVGLALVGAQSLISRRVEYKVDKANGKKP